MSSSRTRFNRSVFAVRDGKTPEQLVGLINGEDIELLIDARQSATDRDRLAALCAETETYFVTRPELTKLADNVSAEPDAAHAWAARMAMRHRTCVLGDPRVCQAIATLVGLRVIDLDRSPAPIATSQA